MQKSTLRTLNVIKNVDGITERLQVNIAYEHIEGLTLAEAREFEHAMETGIQALLYDFSEKPKFPRNIDSKIHFIPMDQALVIANRPTEKAFSNWKIRYNARHLDMPIITRPGFVEINSLYRALGARQEGQVAA